MLHHLSPVEPSDTAASLLSSLRTAPQRSDSPTSSIDSQGSFPTEGSSTTSSSSDTPSRPWGGRPFAAVAAMPARMPAKPTPSPFPAPEHRATVPVTPERGSSAPTSPGERGRTARAFRVRRCFSCGLIVCVRKCRFLGTPFLTTGHSPRTDATGSLTLRSRCTLPSS
jgi:hypothetical protein